MISQKARIRFDQAWQFKPTVIPAGFKLVIDTREQLPLFQNSEVPRMSKVLHHGDYSIQGFESMVTIERKQTSDFLTYIGVDRKRTAEKLESIQDFFFKALVIETDNPFDVPFFSSISVESIRGFLKQARVLYGLHIYWSKHRTDLEQFILDHLTYCYIVLRRNIDHHYGIPPDKSI